MLESKAPNGTAMSRECPERRRLAEKVAEAIAAVVAVRDQKIEAGSENKILAALLEARAAQRDTEKMLHDHIAEHGCSSLKRS